MGTLREVVIVILALLVACSAALDEGAFTRARDAMAKGDMAAVEAEIGALPDPMARDMLRVQLATVNPARGATLCQGVTTPYGKSKCQEVIGRPHLQSIKP